MKLCLECEKPIQLSPRYLKTAKYCSRACRNRKYLSLRHPPSRSALPSSTVGTIHVLAVMKDLLRRGYEVFMALNPNAHCDLVVVHRQIVHRVEVTTGYRRKSGALSYPPHRTQNYDLLAVVVEIEQHIEYIPALSTLGL